MANISLWDAYTAYTYAYTYYTDDTAMAFSASKQKEGQCGVGDTP